MFFIFGWNHKKVKNFGPVFKHHCDHCDNDVLLEVCTISTWFTLFFIPVIPYEKKHVLICPICNYGFELDNIKFNELRAQAEAISLRLQGATGSKEYEGKTDQLDCRSESRSEQFAEVLLTATLGLIVDNVSRPFDILGRTLGDLDEQLAKQLSKLGDKERRKAEIEMLVFVTYIVIETCLINKVPYEVLDKYKSLLNERLTEFGFVTREEQDMLTTLYTERHLTYSKALQNQTGSGPIWHLADAVITNMVGDEAKFKWFGGIGFLGGIHSVGSLYVYYGKAIKSIIDDYKRARI